MSLKRKLKNIRLKKINLGPAVTKKQVAFASVVGGGAAALTFVSAVALGRKYRTAGANLPKNYPGQPLINYPLSCSESAQHSPDLHHILLQGLSNSQEHVSFD